MFKLLLKTRFSMFFSGNTANKKNKKSVSPKAGKVLMIILFAFLALYFTGAMFLVFIGSTAAAAETGELYIPFTLAVIISLALGLLGSIFPTKTQIFESKDNELLLSMPIEPKYIFTSRLTFLLIINFMLETVIMLPAMVCYGIFIGYSVLGFIFTVLVYLLIPFLTLSLSSFIAWVISLAASKVKNKTLITVVLFIIFFGAYMLFMGSIGFLGGSGELDNIDMSGFKDIFLISWASNAMTYGSILDFLFFLVACIIPTVIAYYFLDKSFIKIITTKKGSVKIKYKEKAEKAEGVSITLLKKELKRFFTSSAYILNEGMGVLMSVIFTVMVAIVAPDLINELELEGIDASPYLPIVAFAVIAFASCMNIVSAPSISLEDRNLWILQSLPVRPFGVLMAKINMHMVICTPGNIVCSVILGIMLNLSVVDCIIMLITLIALTAFNAYFGLLLGLLFPKFNWENENIALKQGFAVFGAMFGSMLWTGIMIAIAAVFTITVNFIVGAIIVAVINAGVCLPIHLYLRRGGEKRFATLKQ